MKTRELTNNEKILLSILEIAIIVWVAYRFIITPQREKISTLNEQRLEYQQKIEEMNLVLRKESDINKEWETLHREKEQIISKYFPKLDQAQIIYLLNDLIEHENVSIVDLNFSKPSFENLGGFQVKNMEISLPYNGEYGGIVDIVNAIKKSPRKILVDSLSMDRNSGGTLNGNMSLKIYSLEGIADGDEDVIYIDMPSNSSKETPFAKYRDFAITEELEDERRNLIAEKGNMGTEAEDSPYIEKTLLDFESGNNYFIPSQPLVKGNVMRSTNAKSKKYSLRFEYNILAVEKENRAYVDISKNNITLKYPPNSIGLWVYSYDYSPATIGIGFRGQMGEDQFVPLTKGIGWTGWKYLRVSPPSDLEIYPLKLNKLYIDMPKDREEFGVILMDKLEAVYIRNLGEDGSDGGVSDYIFHVVGRGDTVEKISLKYYATKDFSREIMKLNELKLGDILPIDKVLVLKKP